VIPLGLPLGQLAAAIPDPVQIIVFVSYLLKFNLQVCCLIASIVRGHFASLGFHDYAPNCFAGTTF
jgi:hypothetical protein